MSDLAKGYEFFDHTADIGISAGGKTLAELFIHAAKGLTALIAEESHLEPNETRAIQLSAENVEALLLVWLTELLFWFSRDRFLPVSYTLDDATPTSLRGSVRGGRFDPARHTQGREVKAITRHQLSVRQEADGWHARVLVDI
jgi:SHS2 domain-containing protein